MLTYVSLAKHMLTKTLQIATDCLNLHAVVT